MKKYFKVINIDTWRVFTIITCCKYQCEIKY